MGAVIPAFDQFDEKWGGYAYYWAQHARQMANMARMLTPCSPMDLMEDNLRDDWHRSNRLNRCDTAC